MCKRVIFCLALACLRLGYAEAQVTERINSHGSEIIVTSWIPNSETVAAVLLVPGWGGGPGDVLGIAGFLSANGVEVFVLTPRGWHESEGEASFHNALDDIETALTWARKRAGHDIVIGGHSFGGGMSLAYAARDPSVRQVISVGGTDHGQLIRQYESDPSFAEILDPILAGTAAPEGPIRFSVEASLRELAEGQAIFGLRENAESLGDRSVLMFGGWEDVHTTVDDYLLPLYRSLKAAGASDVKFVVFHTNHGFGNVRESLYQEILGWLQR